MILGEHVTLEAGTGAVHTAPGHGLEDFVGRQALRACRSTIRCGNDGRFLPDTPLVGGLKLDEANAVIIEELQKRGRLLHHEPFRHSYPHCWRHKTPVIFRATPQWFISMDAEGPARARAARHPEGAVDAGLGRAAHHRHDREPAGLVHLAPAHLGRADPAVRAQGDRRAASAHAGADRGGRGACREGRHRGLVRARPRELLGADADALREGHRRHGRLGRLGPVVRVRRHARVRRSRAPVELYLEGSDQHRGWFHTSLLMSEALYERAPYKGVLTHGFTVDEKGRKMSKSLGNVIAPQKVMSTLGADVLRLWVAATDYADEMSVSDEILKRMAESYRRMRNTLRFLLGNLHGFDPAAACGAPADSWWRSTAGRSRARAQLQEEVVDGLSRATQFHLIYQKVHNFCVDDLGGFYSNPQGPAVHHARGRAPRAARRRPRCTTSPRAMVRWLAPILSFTAEEIWRYLPGERAESVFLDDLARAAARARRSRSTGTALIELRGDVLRELEKLREAGTIGAPLDAEVDVYCAPREYPQTLQCASATSCASCSSPRPRACSASHAAAAADAVQAATPRPASGSWCSRAAQRSACAAGTTARTSDRVAEHPRTVRALREQLAEPGEQRMFA